MIYKKIFNIFRKIMYESSHTYIQVISNAMANVPTINYRQKMNRKANASAKSKELQPHPQADTVAAHLLLPNRTTTV